MLWFIWSLSYTRLFIHPSIHPSIHPCIHPSIRQSQFSNENSSFVFTIHVSDHQYDLGVKCQGQIFINKTVLIVMSPPLTCLMEDIHMTRCLSKVCRWQETFWIPCMSFESKVKVTLLKLRLYGLNGNCLLNTG